MLEQERSKTKNSPTKNADKSKREVPKSEFEGREDKSALENAKALKHIIKLKIKSIKEEKWKNKALLKIRHKTILSVGCVTRWMKQYPTSLVHAPNWPKTNTKRGKIMLPKWLIIAT